MYKNIYYAIMFMLLNKSSKADRSNVARQEETPEQRQARLDTEVQIKSIIYIYIAIY